MPSPANRSVFRTRKFWSLFGQLLLTVLKLVSLIVIAVAPLILLLQYLSPLWACLVYWLLALLSERLEFWLHGKITVTDMWMFIANLSLGLVVAYVAPDIWWIRLPALLVTPVAAFALSEWLRAAMGIPRQKEAGYMPPDEDTAKEKCKHFFPLEALPNSSRANRSDDGLAPSSGDRFELAGNIDVMVLDVVEERFGPIRDVDYLVDGQILLLACSASSRLLASADGRYIVSVINYGEGMIIFDRRQDILYRLRTDAFWMLYSLDEGWLTGCCRRTNVPPSRARLDDMIAVAEQDPLVVVGELKVARSDQEYALKYARDIKNASISSHSKS